MIEELVVGRWYISQIPLRDGSKILRFIGPFGPPIDLHPRMPENEIKTRLDLLPNYVWENKAARELIYGWIMGVWNRLG